MDETEEEHYCPQCGAEYNSCFYCECECEELEEE